LATPEKPCPSGLLKPVIDPLLVSVVIEQPGLRLTPAFGEPWIEPPTRTAIDEPLLSTVPIVGTEMVCGILAHANAEPGAPNAASAISEAPASSAAREPPTHAAVNGDWMRATL